MSFSLLKIHKISHFYIKDPFFFSPASEENLAERSDLHSQTSEKWLKTMKLDPEVWLRVVDTHGNTTGHTHTEKSLIEIT